MKTTLAALALLGFCTVPSLASGDPAPPPAPPPEPQSLEGRASYIIGLNLARTLVQQGVPANIDRIVEGLRDGHAGTAKMNEAEIQATMQEFQQKMTAAHEAKQKAAADAGQKAADEFLAKNKAKAGVVTTASGLQYEVLKAGTGAKPKPEEQVTVHYKGTLLDGTVFDSSYDRGQPASFPLDRVIAGWTEALQLMAVGAKHKLYIPPALAYGERGAGDKIGPNALLVFEVELLSIGGPQPAAEPTATPQPNR